MIKDKVMGVREAREQHMPLKNGKRKENKEETYGRCTGGEDWTTNRKMKEEMKGGEGRA